MNRSFAMILALSAVEGLALLTAIPARAQKSDDSDLSGSRPSLALPLIRAEGRVEDGVRVFKAVPVAAPTAATGRLLLTDPAGAEFPARGVKVSLLNGTFETQTDDKGEYVIPGATPASIIRFRFENSFWAIKDADSGKAYQWEAAPGTFKLDPKTANGKIGYIQLQFLEAFDLFKRSGVKTDFWKRPLGVSYPDSADYFSPWDFGLHLTRPEAWDVNLHELGHAVMAAGTRSFGGGGQHKIDECYNEGLAWSEGWATFFAAAVRLSPEDKDAKFEYLVPRRAPIRIENVPDDVCKGDRNEWRVAAGLWDLYDSNGDGQDAAAIAFRRLWTAIRDKRMGSFGDAWGFIAATLTPEERPVGQAALAQNTLSVPGAPAARRRWWPWPVGDGPTAVPDFDGARRRR